MANFQENSLIKTNFYSDERMIGGLINGAQVYLVAKKTNPETQMQLAEHMFDVMPYISGKNPRAYAPIFIKNEQVSQLLEFACCKNIDALVGSVMYAIRGQLEYGLPIKILAITRGRKTLDEIMSLYKSKKQPVLQEQTGPVTSNPSRKKYSQGDWDKPLDLKLNQFQNIEVTDTAHNGTLHVSYLASASADLKDMSRKGLCNISLGYGPRAILQEIVAGNVSRQGNYLRITRANEQITVRLHNASTDTHYYLDGFSIVKKYM